jgi:uncharacterized protein (TIGR02246 family)
MTISLAEVADRLALRELVDAYARAVDRRDGEGFAALFTQDGQVYTDPARRNQGWAALRAIPPRLARYHKTTHFVGQHTVNLDGDTATGEAYCLAHHLYDINGRTVNRIMSIRYQDQYVRSGAGWLFKERRLEVDWIEHRPLGSEEDAPPWTK